MLTSRPSARKHKAIGRNPQRSSNSSCLLANGKFLIHENDRSVEINYFQASRIDEHGTDSAHPLKYSHIDMGGCEGDHPSVSFPNPLVTLVAGLVLPHV